MSEQILLQGKILGTEGFLLSRPGAASPGRSNGEELLAGRSLWVTLLCEVLPRALLAEFGLARVLLGSSGGGQFLLVLPGESRPAAEDFLAAAASQVAEISGQHLQLLWGVTENLGDWSVVRKRLNEAFDRKRVTPLAVAEPDVFSPFVPAAPPDMDAYFAKELGHAVREAASIGWSPDSPAMVRLGSGKHTWSLTSNLSLEGITLARHAAPSEDGNSAATVATLARRAQGRSLWGVLRGDVDNFGVRLRRLTSIEEHVRLSVLYKQFFAGELEVLCSMPEFWRKVTILYSGGDDFAVYGSWDALLPLARELQRLFHRFTEEYLSDFPGPEAKTISMAVALSPEMHYPVAAVYEEAGHNLELAKAADKDCIFVLGRVLEWKQLADAADFKDNITKLVGESRLSRQFLQDLRGFYQRQASADDERNPTRDRRFQRRINRILSGTRDREFLKLRTHLINEIVGRKAAGEVKLRPAGLVGLEWARMTTEV